RTAAARQRVCYRRRRRLAAPGHRRLQPAGRLGHPGRTPGRGRIRRRRAGVRLKPSEEDFMRLTGLPFVAALALTACVTINVYFPAAEAREAAREFVENVIGEEGATQAPDVPGEGIPGGMALRAAPASQGVAFDPWMLLGIAPAHAQTPDIT